jgi:hypothetical protein
MAEPEFRAGASAEVNRWAHAPERTIARVRDGPRGTDSIVVDQWEELLKVASALSKPVLEWSAEDPQSSGSTYFVQDGSVAYVYRGAPTPVSTRVDPRRSGATMAAPGPATAPMTGERARSFAGRRRLRAAPTEPEAIPPGVFASPLLARPPAGMRAVLQSISRRLADAPPDPETARWVAERVLMARDLVRQGRVNEAGAIIREVAGGIGAGPLL